jgi:hypothetical protein
MSSGPRKKKGNDLFPSGYVDVGEAAKDLKPGETMYIGDLLVVPVFPLDKPEPITNYGKAKPRKKRKR